MQFTTVFVTLLATAVMANPVKRTGGGGGGGSPAPYVACPPGLYSNPQCCSVDVEGVADLDCASPTSTPSSAASFQSICAKGGQQAACCVVPVLGQAVLCETPVGL
ncbi:hydrophobin precursor [Xylaria bambusicola]|uniref:hydrophobin precursor n=1 Tax=Xylaria bambusicola TaxID=326684 RepID=UPI0020075ABA|nr:hydrophobin precursor [Xylaria bambusicola]KAI0518272.1 hydrophobin precursor [Xylaria bambusicola]